MTRSATEKGKPSIIKIFLYIPVSIKHPALEILTEPYLIKLLFLFQCYMAYRVLIIVKICSEDNSITIKNIIRYRSKGSTRRAMTKDFNVLMPSHVKSGFVLYHLSVIRACLNTLLAIYALRFICNWIKESFRRSLHRYAVYRTYLHTGFASGALIWFTYLHNISIYQYFLYALIILEYQHLCYYRHLLVRLKCHLFSQQYQHPNRQTYLVL